MVKNMMSATCIPLTIVLFICLSSTRVECGFYSWMADAMGWNSGWESKGVTFGLKSKGMTAIIPIPLPIPIFSKDKKKDDGGGDGGGGGGDTKGDSGGGWEAAGGGGSDWWK